MIKKLLLIIFLISLVISCGKKSDPEYKANDYKIINKKI